MKSNFDKGLELTLKYEGGYTNDPYDSGGPTNYGITIATLSHELGRKATIKDVKNISMNVVKNIYKKKYWNLVDGDDLPSGVDILAFDIAVNSGPGRVLPWLEASKSLAPIDRIKYLDKRRRNFYQSLKTFWRFGKGWMAREKNLLSHALALASQK